MPIIYYIYVGSIAIAFISSLISFRLDYPFHLKLFSILLGLTFVVEFFVTFIEKKFHYKNNYWIYNAFTLVEFWVYAYWYYSITTIKNLKKVMLFFLFAFPVFWFITVFFVFGFNVWNSYVIIVGSFFSIVFVASYYYQLISSPSLTVLRLQPEFWIATGMLIFYLGALPYFGMLNFLMKNHMSVAVTLLTVLITLDIFMYLLFSYGFLCQIINTKKSS